MSGKAEARQAIERFIDSKTGEKGKLCTVDSVDLVGLTCYCIPKDGSADIFGVRLMAKSLKGFLIIPELNSDVIVSFIDPRTAYVSMFSTVQEIQFNGDIYGGIPKAGTLAAKLNTLEALENTLKAIVVAINAAGTGSPGTPVTNGTLAALFTGYNIVPIVPTTSLELQNTTVKHGNGT